MLQAGVQSSDVAAVGISGQMHGMVCLDKVGNPLRPAIIWADQRSTRQVDAIYRKVGAEDLGHWTGNPLATGFMLASWEWIIENEPEVARNTHILLLPKDWIRYGMTGEIGCEPSDASSTLLFNPFKRQWSIELLNALEIDSQILPRIYKSCEVAGGLRKEWAQSAGLAEGIPVVYGGSDQALQAVGNNILRPGVISCTIGTGGQLLAPAREPVYDPQLRLHLFCHAAPDLWHLEAATLSAGLSLKWLRDNILIGESYSQMADLAARAPVGSEGLLYHPYLVGERTPLMDPQACASFTGLTLQHQRGHLVRAVMEGVVMSLRQGLELILNLGVPCDSIVASGGGTRHPLWLQLQADIFNRPIHQTSTREAAAFGAALLAGVGAGLYSDIYSACQQIIHWHNEVIEPDPKNVQRYQEQYRRFIQWNQQ